MSTLVKAAEGAAVDRASADDLVSLATDVGSAPMQVGAVLVLDTGGDFVSSSVIETVGERIRTVPRLRQRLVSTPVGCGRPVWIDDTRFDLDAHLRVVACPAPGDEQSLLRVAATAVASRLPSDRPLWRLLFVTGLTHGRTGVIVVFHHVLADGIGGLAVLANLVDGAAAPTGPTIGGDGFPRPAPSSRALALEALRARRASLRDLGGSVRRARDGASQLLPAARAHAVPCSLNRPTGPRRQFEVVRVGLDEVRRVAHDHGATVNDVVLSAVAAALHTLTSARGEPVDRFVVSVPVSARSQTSATQLGNQVGVVPVELPATGDPVERLEAIAAMTRAAKSTPRAASSAVLNPVFRLLARVGLFGWMIDRQRLVHTFVTNLRGPQTQLQFLGAPVTEVIPLAVVTGNVTVSFAVLSYAGTLGITVIADPDTCPDLDMLCGALQDELDHLAGVIRD